MAIKPNVAILDFEKEFPVDQLFFSTTDPQGVILHGNQLFVDISEYSEEELVGAPHSLIRHPDMPRAVFQLLWDTIKAGKTIAAYVKNRAKTGKYYWVLALVMPCRDGYLSIRLKPTSGLFAHVRKLYGQLLHLERTIEVEPKQRKAAIAASTAELGKQLLAHGFRSYEDFMLHALATEMDSRYQQMEDKSMYQPPPASKTDRYGSLYQHCAELDQKLRLAYQRIEEFKKTNIALMEKSISILSMAESIRTLSLNATIAASKLGSKGATLQVVSESLGTVSDDSQEATRALASRMEEVVGILDHLIFDLAATKLQSEVSLQFVQEIMNYGEQGLDPLLDRSLETLFQQTTQRMETVFLHLKNAESGMSELRVRVHRLARNNKTLRFVQFAGEKESIGWPDMEAFAEVFKLVRQQIDSTKMECDHLAQSIAASFRDAKQLSESRVHFLPHLDVLNGFQLASA